MQYRIWAVIAAFLLMLGVTMGVLRYTESGTRALQTNEELAAADKTVYVTAALGRWQALLVRCAQGSSTAFERLQTVTPEVQGGLVSARRSGQLGQALGDDAMAIEMTALASPLTSDETVSQRCQKGLDALGERPVAVFEQGYKALSTASYLRELAVQGAAQPRGMILWFAAVLMAALFATLSIYLTAYHRGLLADEALAEARDAKRASDAFRADMEILAKQKEESLDIAVAARRDADAQRQLADEEVRAREEALRRAELAERDKLTFLGMATHELRTPLHNVLNAVNSMRAMTEVPVKGDVFRRLDRNANALEAQLADLIDFAELTSGRMTLRYRRFSLSMVVEHILDEFAELLERKGLGLEWHPNDDIEEELVADPKRLRQILANLYSNAIKYTEQGGIEIKAWLNDDRTELTMVVQDTGMGIPEDKLELIFEPYVRVTSLDLEVRGHGLGLAVVKKLVTAMNGRVSVQSRMGEGSRFEVVVPVNQPIASPSTPRLPQERKSLLIVEDDSDLLAGLNEGLTAMGWQVAIAMRVSQALAALNQQKFDAVLADLGLPDGSGVEVARAARKLRPTTRTVLLSANAFMVSQEDRDAFDAVMSKPSLVKDIDDELKGIGATT